VTSEHQTSLPGPAADIRNRAASWLVRRRDHEDWTAEDQVELDAWLAEFPANKIAFLRVDAAWKRADRLGALRTPLPKHKWLAPVLKFVSTGAAAALVLGGVYLTMPREAPPPGELYVTGVGGRETLTLRDGSKIELNTNTALRVGGKGTQRTVWLEKGEAFFQIVHNEAHPFVVFAGTHRITDLGTKFLVRRENQMLRVSLLEGKAQFDSKNSRGSQQATLNPGDVLVATAKSLSVTERPSQELTDELSWRSGLLVFRHASLVQAAAEYNRYNIKKIVITDPKIAELNINGALPANDPHALTRSAQRLFNLRIEERPGEIIITH